MLLTLYLYFVNAFVFHYWLSCFVYKAKFVLLPTMKAYRTIRIMTLDILNP